MKQDIQKLIIKLKKLCKKNGRKFYLANNLKLAIKSKFRWVYYLHSTKKYLCKNKLKKNLL